MSTHYGTFFHAYRPRPGDVVLDIGAGIGTEVIELSRLVGSNGLVIALEPNPNLFMRLLWAITEMKLSNVVALPLGLGAHRGPMDLSVDEDSDPDMVGGSLIGNSLVTLRVAITTLPALLDSLGVPRVNYAKVNIEGAERDVIKASGRALLRIDNWCISCHDFLPDEEVHTLVDVLGAMHAVGLKPFLNPNAASGTASSCYVYTQSDSSSDDSPAVDLEA